MFGGLGLLEMLRVPTEIAKHSVSVQPTESWAETQNIPTSITDKFWLFDKICDGLFWLYHW